MSLNRNPPFSLQNQLDKLSLPTIDSLPDELLLPIFNNLSPFERALLLQTCNRWNQVILLHTPFWQYLHLSENFSPSSIVKILSVFNDRSGCRLKHVIIEAKTTTVKHLNRIFAQLKRSGSSLNVLALLQERKLNGKTRALAVQHLPMLDSLVNVSDLEIFTGTMELMSGPRVELDIENQSNAEIGLRLYFTEALLQLTQEEFQWLSKLRYLWVVHTDSITSMRRILETTENLVGLDLSGWTTMEEPSSNTIRSLSLKSDSVHLRSLEELVCPRNIELTAAMDQMLEIDGDQTLLFGDADSLIMWKVTGLKAVCLSLVPSDKNEQVETSVQKTRQIFRLNPTIQSLTLRCSYGGEQHHINKILYILDAPFHYPRPGTIAEGEESSYGSFDNPVLPHLVKLIIEDVIMLDGRLLREIVEYRTRRNSHFQIEVTEFGSLGVVALDDWEARGWMN